MSGKDSGPLAQADVESPCNMEDGGKEDSSSVSPKNKKSKSGTLRRAFSWLKGRKKKKKKNEEAPSQLVEKKSKSKEKKSKSKEKAGNSKAKAAPKLEDDKKLSVHYKASQHQQENVFFPSGRPPYLEDLHLEAQEGLFSLQQQEKQKLARHGIDVPDDQCVQLSQTDGEVEFRGRSQSFAIESAVEDSLSIRSEMIQRKGSTFKPYNHQKKAGQKQGRERKPRRTTIMGIPQHVEKELGFNRVRDTNGHQENQMRTESSDSASEVGLSSQPSSESDQTAAVVHIPTIDGAVQGNNLPDSGVRVSLHNIETIQPSVRGSESEAALQKHINKVYYDDAHLGCRMGPRISPQLRPKSLAVPGMTTSNFHNERRSPVMLMSPQATYLSKIITNAVLPASVDLVAISRNSVRTLSRGSLMSASPASVRSSMQSSVRTYNSRNHSSSSENWSHSQSTETIVSNSSTISSKGSHGGVVSRNGVNVEHKQENNRVQKPAVDPISINSTANWVNATSATNGRSTVQDSYGLLTVKQTGSNSNDTDLSPACSVSSVADASDTASIRSGRSGRNVSVKKMKKVPPPPRRTYSLHQQGAEVASREQSQALEKECTTPIGDPWVLRPGKSTSAEDDVFSPTSLSETSSVRSESLTYSADYSSPDISRCSESPLARNQLLRKDLVIKGQQLPNDLSPQKLNCADKFDRTMSPSSGYSSQSGTPTLSTKGLISYPSSPGRKRAQPKKPERTCSLHSPAMSVSSSLTSLSSAASDPIPQEQTVMPNKDLPISSETTTTVVTTTVSLTAKADNKEEFVIPPHPKVPAPQSPPPPEVRDKVTSVLAVINSSIPQKPSMSKRIKEKLAALPVSAPSPPPSPPPSHQPPPPPMKNTTSVSEATISSLSSLSSSTSVSSEVAQVPKVEPSWPLPPPPALEDPVLPMESFPTPGEVDFLPPPPPVEQDSSLSVGTSSAEQQKLPNIVPSASPSVAAEVTTSLDNKVTPLTSAEDSSKDPCQEKNIVSHPHIPPPPPLPVSLKSSHMETTPESLILKPSLPMSAPKLPQQKQSDVQVPEPAPPPAPAPPPPSFLKANGQLQRSFQKRANSYSHAATKEPHSRSKSTLSTKEDANLPIVTPSLLQMVRLRSVNVNSYDLGKPDKKQQDQSQQNGEENGIRNPAIPQKPLRKSLSLRIPPSKEPVPSMQLQNAVRLKTSALSSKHFPGPVSPKPAEKAGSSKSSAPAGTGSPTNTSVDLEGQPSPKLHEEGGIHKSPAQTASFIFAKSPKKVIIETPTSPEAQSDLKRNLVAELMSVSGHRNSSLAAVSNQQNTEASSKPLIQKKPSKAPPPVARKPVHLSSSLQPQLKSPNSPQMGTTKQPFSVDDRSGHSTDKESRMNTGLPNDHTNTVQLVGQETQQVSPTEAKEEAGTTVRPSS